MLRMLKLNAISLLFLFATSQIFAQEEIPKSSNFTVGFLSGYTSGLGFQGNITFNNFVEEFPFQLRLGLGYTLSNPGNAPDARRIFINNATNGVPEKKGSTFDYRFDFLVPASIFKVQNSYLIFGPRYSAYKGNFKFIGGNEDFDVKSKQWGIGLGIEHQFQMTSKLNLVLAYGADYYFSSTLKGHDTSYSPDNDNVNPRKDNQNGDVYFTYKDANEAIKQPKIVPRAMVGISFGL